MDILNIQPHKVSESLSDKIFLFHGGPGTRKTSIASKFPNSVLGAFEIGYKYIDGVKAQPLSDWRSMKNFVRQLDSPRAKEMYSMVAIDTVSLAYSACYDHVLKQEGIEDPGDLGYGKGWRLIRKEFEKTMLKIPQMGYGLILIAHSEDGKDDDEYKTKVDIDKRPAAIIKGLADFILYLKEGYKVGEEKTEENKTVYAFTNSINIETKSRLNHIAPYFEFTYENLKDEISKALEKKKLQEGIVTDEEGENLHKQEEESFEKIQKETIELAKEISSHGEEAQNEVKNFIVDILGVSISKATKVNKGKLVGLKEKLEDLKEELNG